MQQEFQSGGRVGYQDGTPNPDMVMPQPKPQEVQQPQQPSYSPFGFGGLANLFMNMRRF